RRHTAKTTRGAAGRDRPGVGGEGDARVGPARVRDLPRRPLRRIRAAGAVRPRPGHELGLGQIPSRRSPDPRPGTARLLRPGRLPRSIRGRVLQRLRGRRDIGGSDPARPPRTGGKGRLRTWLVRGPAAEGDRRRLAALTTNTSHGGPYPPARVRRPTLRQQDRPAL